MIQNNEDLTDFFLDVNLERVQQGCYLDSDMFVKKSSYDWLRYEKMDIGAVAIIVNKDRNDHNCILGVSRKNNSKDFGLPGGKSDDGENILQTLEREVKEETGLAVTRAKLVYVARAIDKLCFTFIVETSDLNYTNVEEHLGAKLQFIMLGDLLVLDYPELANIILGKNNWSSDLYFGYLNRYKVRHRQSTFCSYNFRSLQKLLDFRTKTIADSSPIEEEKAYGAFKEDYRHLFNQALFEAQFLNLLDTEKMLES